MNNKKTKTIGIITNVLVVVILVFVALITLSIILSQGKGYTSLFGNAYVSVQSDSMEGAYDDSFQYDVKGFKKGDLIRVHILSDEEKADLKVGDVITFYQILNGERVLNTHRIIGKNYSTIGVSFITQGDKASLVDAEYATELVSLNNVVGKYNGHRIAGFGKAVDFFHSSAGFFVCVVLPSLIIVAYFAFNLIVTIRNAKKEDKAEAYLDEKEKMRQELMEELRGEGKIKEDAPADDESGADPNEEKK